MPFFLKFRKKNERIMIKIPLRFLLSCIPEAAHDCFVCIVINVLKDMQNGVISLLIQYLYEFSALTPMYPGAESTLSHVISSPVLKKANDRGLNLYDFKSQFKWTQGNSLTRGKSVTPRLTLV